MLEFLSPTYKLEQEHFISRPRDEVFLFFADPFNLEHITPPFLQFKIISSAPIDMNPDTLIDYSLSLYGVRFRWRTRIESHTPDVAFIDTQESGPYKLWHHTHTFEDVEGGTLMRDLVRYQVPFGPLGQLAHAIFVRRALNQIFEFRRNAIDRIMVAS
jgi:ligand-binding SRPBCC domain-containing protein